jgi:hypothetical protein
VGSEVIRDITTIALAIVGLAIFATLVSKNAQTSQVVGAFSSAYNTGLGTALGPVTGYNPGPPVYASSGTGIGDSLGLLEPGQANVGGQW